MKFNLDNIIEYENDEDMMKSKMFGSPVFPKRFIRKRHLENYYFLMQINLEDLNDKLTLPSDGLIYIFLDIENGYKPKVLYTQEVIAECVDYIDQAYSDLGQYNAIYLSEGTSHKVIEKEDDEVILLSLDLNKLPKGYLECFNEYSHLDIRMPFEDVSICNFDNVRLSLE